MNNLTDWVGWSKFRPSPDRNGSNVGVLTVGSTAAFVYEFAEDWRGLDCLAFDIWLPDERAVELEVQVFPLKIGRPEYIEKTTASIVISGQGWKTVELPFAQFDYLHSVCAFWRFIHKVTVSFRFLSSEPAGELLLHHFRLKHLGSIHLSSDVLSKPARTGETVIYEFSVHNESDHVQAVAVSLEKYGWESLAAEIEPGRFVLEPGEGRTCELRVLMNERAAPGGYEVQKVKAIPNGDANYAKQLEFITVKELPRPYILHTEDGWDEVKEKIRNYDWAKQSLEAYVRTAEEWVVPNVRGKEYAFDLNVRFPFMSTAIAWKLTGRREFLEKCALLLRRFADPNHGYPSTRSSIFHSVRLSSETENESTMIQKVCSGGLIHEGEFLFDLTAGYDLLYDADIWTEEDRRLIREALLLFIRKADWAITDGDTNNIPAGGMAAALLCSLVIQDMHWIKRFLHGHNGVTDLLATGLMDDGWYFEGAANYVVLYADIFTRLVQACMPWGINLRDMHVPASYRKDAMLSPWSFPRDKPFLGMSFEKYGPSGKNYRTIRELWDAMLPYIDYRGILFGINDSTEYNMRKLYDHAYYLYRDPAYTVVIRNAKERDLLYGVGDLPETDAKPYSVSTYSDNVGLCVLRSQTEGREQEGQIQAVLKYGTHGGYHGHFDRASLLSIMKHGKSVYNPEAAWYGYFSFLFKMWVQTSMAHNMVVVDQRMQEPAESKRLMFHSGSMLQACAVETFARWCDPPYGGQTPYPERFPEDRIRMEGRTVAIPDVPREQGVIGDYSEPVLQRRMMLVTDDYIVVADYLRGEEEHQFDCLFHLQGFREINGLGLALVRNTPKMNETPYGAGQFITNCSWYECAAPAVLHFEHEYEREKDNRDGKHSRFNDPGMLKLDVHALWPPRQEIMVGAFPEAYEVNKYVTFEVKGDGETVQTGQFGAWIVGQAQIDVLVEGMRELTLSVSVSTNKKKTIFLGNLCLLTADGRKLNISELEPCIEFINVDRGNGNDVDYYGGNVQIAGIPYDQALPFEPENHQTPAVLKIRLDGLNVSRFMAVLGGDFPIGDELEHRKTVSLHTSGKEALFISLLEPYAENRTVRSAAVIEAGKLLRIELTDGRVQLLEVKGLDGDGRDIAACLSEYKDEELIRQERT